MGAETNRGPSGVPLAGRMAGHSHFPKRQEHGFASDDFECGRAERTAPGEFSRCHFSIFRADSVSVTSTRLAGGDWRWRLSGADGAVLVEAGGYPSEAHCRQAVAILQARAGRATVA